MTGAGLTNLRADMAVIGGGAAGLFCALTAAEAGAHVVLVSRTPLDGSASFWAQGGIAAALAPDDSPALHAQDTIAAARAAARPSAVEALCEDSPGRVRELERLGVRFDTDAQGALALGLEGGHSARRIVHAGGAATGRTITQRLSELATTHERITALESTTATGLLTTGDRCAGLVARAGEDRLRVTAPATVLATGGSAALWARTTNPAGSVGVGLALAHAAGAELADLEFMQFHPTALVSPGERDGFLITEAVRGEGALLLDHNGNRFVEELAPRDEVALAIEERMRLDGADSVGIDLRAVDLAGHFPNILQALEHEGFDPAAQPVPVAPASHYTMGGVATDLDGSSSLPGLLAVGECACTGLHGANRLASNSLAECFVLSRRAAFAALDATAQIADTAREDAEPASLPSPPTEATRNAVWQHAGLRRTPEGLAMLSEDAFPVARLIAAACLAREESRGAHQRTDHPETDTALDGRHVVLRADGSAELRDWA